MVRLLLLIALISYSADPGKVESNFSIGSTPSITPAQPAPPLQDRAQSSAGAIAMAAAAAGQQKLACYQMLDAARKEKDKTLKAMMMAMAMQMCAQADQTLQNAYQNREGYKLVSGSDIPKQAEMKIEGMSLSKDKIKEADVLRLEYGDQSTLKGISDNDLTNLVKPVNLSPIGNNVGNGENPSLPSDKNAKYEPKDFSQDFQPQKTMNIEYGDSSQKGSTGTSGGNLSGIGASGNNVSAATPNAQASKPTNEEKNQPNNGIKRNISSLTEAALSSGSSSSNESSSQDYSKILNDLLGGGATDKLDSSNGAELVSLSSEGPTEPSRNIFQYATFRYHTLAYEKGRIRHSRIAQITTQKDTETSK